MLYSIAMEGFGSQFPPPPVRPWWHHLAWALPLMAITAGLGWWQGGKRQEVAAPVKNPPAVKLVEKKPAPSMTVTNRPAPVLGERVPVRPATNRWISQRGVRVYTNATDAARIGLTRIGEGLPNLTANFTPRPVAAGRDLEIQVALDRRGFSPGSIDGMSGPQTVSAIAAFQQQQRLPISGRLDAATRRALTLRAPVFAQYSVSTNDLARPQPLGKTWAAKSRQVVLDYESLLELVAEKHHCSPRYLQKINPLVHWPGVRAGTAVKVPNTAGPGTMAGVGALIHIQLRAKTLRVYDSSTNLVAQFPCSIATRVANRPVGRLAITAVAHPANYTFNPTRFPNTPEARAGSGSLSIPPGPNNPIGTAWFSLSQPGYGIHGSPDPEKIGRTTSLGCFRLANWNAERLLKLVRVGTNVLVE
ncbi:MAG: L,D-transpeptidase family protein [Verrucomicrobiia bacterium]|jgi:lipoprotein-anchoring transpeptidase ErfK/SrfK